MARQTIYYKWIQAHGENVLDVDQLADDYENKELDEQSFKAKYGFVRGTCAPFLESRGKITRKHRSQQTNYADNGPRAFIVDDITSKPGEPVTRTIEIKKTVDDRLRKLEDSKRQYTHRAILEQLLNDILDWYGYPESSAD